MRPVFPLIALCAALAQIACSPRTLGFNRMADALSSTASAYGRDSDPEFVRLGAPSTLKMVEMLLDQQPSHSGLLLTACSGFAQYAYAFLHVDSELLEASNAAAARELAQRAAQMYDRARGYCTRALELRLPRVRDGLLKDPRGVVATAAKADVPLLYWTAVAWGGSLVLAENRMLRMGELAGVRALLTRALELDEPWEYGAIHEAMILLEALPPLVGGSPDRARKHFDRAMELSKGQSATALVTMAYSVSLPAKNRDEFEKLLKAALAVDVHRQPSTRLANLVAQKRARLLLGRAASPF